MITETETINGVASVWIADDLETVEYVATVEIDIEVGAGGGRYVNDTRVTFDEITLGGEDVVSWELEYFNKMSASGEVKRLASPFFIAYRNALAVY